MSIPGSASGKMNEQVGMLYAAMEGASYNARKLVERYISGDGVIVGWGLCRDGELGTNSCYNLVTPLMIGGHDKPIRMACGGLSSAWLGVRNVLMAMGSGMWGELGVGNPRFCPRVMANEANMPICPGQVDVAPFTDSDMMVDVAAGSAYYLCISLKGHIYGWGANNYGQCHPDLTNACCGFAQQRVIPDEVVVQVACSNFTVLARTASGAVYGWGLTLLLGDAEQLQAQAKQAGASLAPAPKQDDRQVLTTPLKMAAFNGKNIELVRAGPWHFAAVTSSGVVYTWGLGNNGRLGHGSQDDYFEPTIVTALSGKQVVEVACGSFHTVFVTSDGEAYACGDNQGGQCGVVGEYFVTTPTRLKVHGGRTVIHASCGRLHTLLLLQNGDVAVYGTGLGLGVGLGYGMRMVRCQPILENYTGLWLESGPTHNFGLTIPKATTMFVLGVPHRGVPVTLTSIGLKEGILSCGVGAGFTLMVSRRGSCYAFGVGGWGQLGFDTSIAKHFTTERVPVFPHATRIAFFSRTTVTYVAAGFSFSMAITEGERVFSWGNNSYGQCGLGVDPRKYQKIPQPREITWLADKEILQVACGSYFALALSTSGDVYSWGAIECCGHGLEPPANVLPPHMVMRGVGKESSGIVLSPSKVTSLKGIIQIAAGGWHALALNAIGEIYAWGIGSGGRLGLGNTDHCHVPTRIAHGAFFTRIGCGCYTSYGIDEDAHLHVWGVNEKNQLGTSGSKVTAPVLVLDNVREACLGKYFTLALTYSNTFHMSGTMEMDNTSHSSSSFTDTDSLPEKLKPDALSAEQFRGVKLFGGLEHVIVLLEKDPIPDATISEATRLLRHQPENIVKKRNA